MFVLYPLKLVEGYKVKTLENVLKTVKSVEMIFRRHCRLIRVIPVRSSWF